MRLGQQFQAASKWLSSSNVDASTEQKLHLYALYKIATDSPVPQSKRPGLLDFTGRAKYDAWMKLGSELAGQRDSDVYGMQESAQELYIDMARQLGWRHEPEDDVSGTETVAQTDSAPKPRNQGMKGVSLMATEEVDDQAPVSRIHELAIEGDAQAIQSYLNESTSVDINELDLYGFSPLHLATDRGHIEAVRVLLKAGANPDIKDEDGNTALELARISEHDDIAALLSR
ncbi:hypothetical protein ACM66B_000305 [Microbotryomycetes sp. NB124-2]